MIENIFEKIKVGERMNYLTDVTFIGIQILINGIIFKSQSYLINYFLHIIRNPNYRCFDNNLDVNFASI